MSITIIAGYGVHILTASGAALALLAMMAAVASDWQAMFLWLGLALIVDAVDGPLARRFEVATRLPRWSGDTLDLVVDFLTYVFVPAYAIAASGLLGALAVPGGILIVVSGALYFADRAMKLPDNSFRGFPALWNLAAFYFLLLAPPMWLAALIVAALAALQFANFPFIHPTRVVRFRRLTNWVTGAWAFLALVAVMNQMAPGRGIVIALCMIAVYVAGVGLLPGAREPI